jgi:hypothetical protein
LTDDRVIASTYNKAKHGATMVRTPELGPREFYVLAPHLRPDGPDDARYSPRKFRVDKAMIATVERNVELVGGTIRFLAGLARALQRAGLLERRAAPRRPRVVS